MWGMVQVWEGRRRVGSGRVLWHPLGHGMHQVQYIFVWFVVRFIVPMGQVLGPWRWCGFEREARLVI